MNIATDTVLRCAECLRMARCYESETMEWFRLEGHLRIAEYGHDEVSAAKIAVELNIVARKRTELRGAIDRHKTDCPSNGSPKTKAFNSC